MEQHEEEGKGCGVDGNVDDIILIPEEKNANQRSAGCVHDEVVGVSRIFRKGEKRTRVEAADSVQGNVLSAAEQEIEDDSVSSSSEGEEDQRYRKKQKVGYDQKKARHNDKEKGGDDEPPWEDQERDFDIDEFSSSSQTRDKSPNVSKKSGNEARKSQSNANTAEEQVAQSCPTTKAAEVGIVVGSGRRGRSWVHTFIKKKRSGRRVCCHCGAEFSAKTGLSSLKYHMENACRMRVHSKEDVFDKNKAHLLLCRLITEDCLSLRVSDSQNLHDYVSYLRPGYKPPGRKMLTEKILPEVKASVEKVMRGKLDSIDYVSVSLDGWTSTAWRNYIAILCHGITSSWTLETFLLNVVSVTESETADYVAEVTRSVLKEWDIPLANVVAIASDGAANMKRSVKTELQRPWIYCLAHAINRSVFKALEREPIKGIVDKAKAVCKLFKYPQAKRELRKKQEALELRAVNMKLCCPTRWGSVHKMLKRMIASRQAIVACLAAQRGQRVQTLNDEEWDIITELTAVLRHLNEASQQLSYQKVPTVGLIVPIFASLLVDHLGGEGDADGPQADSLVPVHYDVQEFKKFLAEDLGKRWDVIQEGAPTELLMSAYLDPRTKDFSFVGNEGKRQQCLERAREKAERLLAESRTESQASHQTPGAVEGVTGREKERSNERGKGKEKDTGEERRKEKEATSIQKRNAKKERMIRIYGRQAACALIGGEEQDDYLAEIGRYHALSACPLFQSLATCANGDPVMLDPLAWWREHQHEYSRLAALARRFLCITPTSVPCERAFSKAGWIVNKRRCSLSDGNVSSILFVSFNKQHRELTE